MSTGRAYEPRRHRNPCPASVWTQTHGEGGAEQAKMVLNDCIQGPIETLVSSSTKG